ncbi:hypothetical protein [Helicobacter winghamensis]|nr:hypothetical protein [Helicobacter winghamensis]
MPELDLTRKEDLSKIANSRGISERNPSFLLVLFVKYVFIKNNFAKII